MGSTKIMKHEVPEGKSDAIYELQEKANEIYRKHANVSVSFIKNIQDPKLWTEIVRFYDEDADAKMKEIDSDPEVRKLYEEFRTKILGRGN